MSLATKNKWNYHSLVFFQTAFVLLGTPLFLFIDSPWLFPYFSHGQTLANAIMIGVYVWLFWAAKRKLQWLMLLMTISSLFAEIFGSLILALYQYRLHNIPLYIPLGHAVIYACIYHLSSNPLIWRFHKVAERHLVNYAFITVFMSLFFLNDVGGFLGYVLFLYILSTRQKRLFYLGMFAMVYYVELCGTVFSTWAWYGVVGNHPNFPHIAYTPCGAAGLYILIDLTSNSIYYYAIKILHALLLFERRFLYIQPES